MNEAALRGSKGSVSGRSGHETPSEFDRVPVARAIKAAFAKLGPHTSFHAPTMLVTELGGLVVTIYAVRAVLQGSGDAVFGSWLALWLWLTVLSANFAEAVAESRVRAHVDELRSATRGISANRILPDGRTDVVAGEDLRCGDTVIVTAGEIVPGDGDVIEGVASVDESAITGDSAPVIRGSDDHHSAVSGGTRVLAERIVVRISSDPDQTLLGRMVKLVEEARRQKTPGEVVFSILLSALTIICLIAVGSLAIFSAYEGVSVSPSVFVALLVCLVPTTIGGLFSTVGIAGVDRLMRCNVLTASRRVLETAGDVDTLLLDKTGAITFGNRRASSFLPVLGIGVNELAAAARLASLGDQTPEGRSIVALAQKYGVDPQYPIDAEAEIVPFSTRTRISGVDVGREQVRKGAADAVRAWVRERGGHLPPDLDRLVCLVGEADGTPLVVAADKRVLGVIHLKDAVKGGIRERFGELRAMGVRTVMLTGDDPLTAAAIAKDVGVDDFIAGASPEMKLELVLAEQEKGRLVAMAGGAAGDAAALAQSDVGVAMNSGTRAAKDASDMVDLDSDPTKLIEIVAIGKQMLVSRESLLVFSVTSVVAVCSAILPAILGGSYPWLAALNVMRLDSSRCAILSAVIFNALVLIAFIPSSLRGVPYHFMRPIASIRRNLLIYGMAGLALPFLGIRLIYEVLVALRMF